MIGYVLGALFNLAWPPLWTFSYRAAMGRLTGWNPPPGWLAFMWGIPPAIVVVAVYLPAHRWVDAATSALSAVAALAWWLWKRRKRKRALKLAGAKSKALLAAIVRKSP